MEICTPPNLRPGSAMSVCVWAVVAGVVPNYQQASTIYHKNRDLSPNFRSVLWSTEQVRAVALVACPVFLTPSLSLCHAKQVFVRSKRCALCYIEPATVRAEAYVPSYLRIFLSQPGRQQKKKGEACTERTRPARISDGPRRMYGAHSLLR